MNNVYAIKITGFFFILLTLFFLLSRSGLLKTIAGRDEPGRWWQIILFSILHIGLIISIALSFLPQEFLNKFSPQTQLIFISETARFFWITAPIVAMTLVRRRREESKS